MNETGWCAQGLPRDNTYCFTIIPMNDYNSGGDKMYAIISSM